MLSEGTNTVMPVSPMMYGNDGFGMGGFGGWWIILFWFAMMNNGMWGNGSMMPYFMMNGNNNNTQNDVNRGFDNLHLSNQISSVQGSVDALGTRGQLDGIQSAIVSGFANTELSAANRAMDQMQANFNAQMAQMQQNFAMQSDFQNCCCENRLANCQTQNLISNEAAQTRANATQNTQTILDKLCMMELDGVKAQLASEQRANNDLRSQLQMANLAASQNAQTAQLMADNAAQTQYMVNRIAPYPVPSYTVGNPYAGVNNCGYNCGCNQ